MDACYHQRYRMKHAFGNNAFSFTKRQKREIDIPPLIDCAVTSMQKSDRIAFVEIDDMSREVHCNGLEYFIRDGNVFLFDNHNHCYYFYKEYLRERDVDRLHFVHVDQHKDMRVPCASFSKFKNNVNIEKGLQLLGAESLYSNVSQEQITSFLYTNLVLNVGNFIVPLQQEGRIEQLYMVDAEYAMDALNIDSIDRYVLDLDLDFFSRDMGYIPFEKRLNFVQKLIDHAEAVFIACSPYFIPFEEAKEVVSALHWRRR